MKVILSVLIFMILLISYKTNLNFIRNESEIHLQDFNTSDNQNFSRFNLSNRWDFHVSKMTKYNLLSDLPNINDFDAVLESPCPLLDDEVPEITLLNKPEFFTDKNTDRFSQYSLGRSFHYSLIMSDFYGFD